MNLKGSSASYVAASIYLLADDAAFHDEKPSSPWRFIASCRFAALAFHRAARAVHGLLLKPSPAAVPKTAVSGFRLIENRETGCGD